MAVVYSQTFVVNPCIRCIWSHNPPIFLFESLFKEIAIFIHLSASYYGTTISNISGNLAKGKDTKQSSTGFGGDSKRAVDGNKNTKWNGKSCTHTKRQRQAWWRVDLASTQKVGRVKVTNRGDCCDDRLKNFDIRVGNTDKKPKGNGL